MIVGGFHELNLTLWSASRAVMGVACLLNASRFRRLKRVRVRVVLFDVELTLRREHFIAGLAVFSPEAQRDRALANSQVMERDVGKPVRQFRIYIKALLVSVRVQSEDRL
jgi:hypothetical protein